jgi:hypothetical protein
MFMIAICALPYYQERMRERSRLGKSSAGRETRAIEHPWAYQMQQAAGRLQLHPSALQPSRFVSMDAGAEHY